MGYGLLYVDARHVDRILHARRRTVSDHLLDERLKAPASEHIFRVFL